MLQSNEISTTINTAEWIPLKASKNDENGNIEKSGYRADFFSCSSMAFFSEKRCLAEQLTWRELGCSHEFLPSIDKDGHYSCIENFEINGKEVTGVYLVFDHPQPMTGERTWNLNPDLIIALRLVKQGNNWVRPEEEFAVVAREEFDKQGNHILIEIKREFLLAYLAARKLSLRLYYCYQRVENVISLKDSPYKTQVSRVEQQNGGEFELAIRKLDDVFNGRWILYSVEQELLDNKNSVAECNDISIGYKGIRVDSVFRRDEWIEQQERGNQNKESL
ncbi:hypothetical protein ACINWC323_2567 [Acinetobacter sp. WC-323]|nr:hypothetical protein ACINWC323_2567 [Acinetobacter sp. WC-323]